MTLLAEWKFRSPADSSPGNIAIALLEGSEKKLNSDQNISTDRKFWLDFLDQTKKPAFLQALGSEEMRNRWAELVFLILRKINYTLLDMLIQRVGEHPEKILFKDMSGPVSIDWTYEQIYRHILEIATVFLQTSDNPPRVAIFSDNCLEGACADLACLCHDIFVSPLSTHFNFDILLHIFDQLNITVAVADSRERLTLLQTLQQKTKIPFEIFSLLPEARNTPGIKYLPEECKKRDLKEIEGVLSKRTLTALNQVATTMFTSGSTGLPKGVSFSIYNIVSKRFARAAALPQAGEEVFLCYLPLFHTFGRFLEMTGAIFWNGTYVFAGNTSAETLLSLFPKINPSGFISIPLRWQELFEKCQEKIQHIESPELREETVREVVGSRLSWGLSAAGYLDPQVFRFFNQYGIQLCSGFGMTEATGGITMTPPGNYRDYTVGIPLPGVYTRLTSESELQLSGHYIAAYLEHAGPGDMIPYPVSGLTGPWLSTGDVFRIYPDGYYEIIDRVKDIYKNNRGQTVAPQVIEKKFYKVPGIKSTFLVGDNRPYNVLLIAPDRNDQIFMSIEGENLTEYFHQIVMAANTDVAPYERVVNFTLLDRDFSSEKGEITPKGSYNRKTIEANFHDLIESLYSSNFITIRLPELTLTIPRWFFRDLGILETDILLEKKSLFNRRSKKRLTFINNENGTVQLGDLKYKISSDTLDLGIFIRQPLLWVGNPELIAFCPVREGWDLPFPQISVHILTSTENNYQESGFPPAKSIRDPKLSEINQLIMRSLFLGSEVSEKAILELGQIFSSADQRLANVIKHRLEALAYHPKEEIRALAYRILLLKTPDPERETYMSPFIESGLSFLNEKSIREIAGSNFGKHRLDALKQRLYWYRTNLVWPAKRRNQRQFAAVLEMLFDFAAQHLEYYVSVRSELSRWILFKDDPFLSKKAESCFYKLAGVFEKSMQERFPLHSPKTWNSKLVFELGISEEERTRIMHILQSTTFLQESIFLTFNELNFDLKKVPSKGIWILRMQAFKAFKHYRLSINTRKGKHFDLHMVLNENPEFIPKPDTFYWLASLAGFPYGPAVAPFMGSSRPNLGVLTTQYIGGLTAWDKIREFSEIHRSAGYIRPNAWKKVFIKAFTVIFRAWHHSGYQIVPGVISPANVVVPEMDFRESAVILSITGWSKYKNTLSLIGPVLQEFYCRTTALYPWCKKQLKTSWIFDACIEALGKDEASSFLGNLLTDLKGNPFVCFENTDLSGDLSSYLESKQLNYHLPLALSNAIDLYLEWNRMNPDTTPAAKEQTLIEFMELYKLQGYPELIRYYFYRHSYFCDSVKEVKQAFDALLESMKININVLPIQLLELSELQSVIMQAEDKNIFSRMVFPRLQRDHNIDFLKVGERMKEHVVIRINLTDKRGVRYTQREPVEPREIGQLYQLFFRENYPKEISEMDHHIVVADENDKIIGGLTWRFLDPKHVLLDGIVVTSSLQGKGIGSAMIQNFFTNMAARGVKIVKAHFLFGNYYMKHYFEVDQKWGALIKVLGEE